MLTKIEQKNLKRLERKDNKWDKAMERAGKKGREINKVIRRQERVIAKFLTKMNRTDRKEKMKAVKSMRLKPVKAMRLKPIC